MTSEVRRIIILCALAGTALLLAANVLRIGTEGLSGVSPADFPNYYFGGKRFFEGRPVYAPLGPEVKEALGWDYFVYPADPPFAVALLAPLALLPYAASWWLLLILSIVLICGTSFAAARLNNIPRAEAALLGMIAVLSIPSLFLLRRNHMESLLLPLSIGGWLLFKRERNNSAMVLWGLAAAIKLFPAIWILAAWRAVGTKSAITGIISAAAFTALGCLAVGSEGTLSFVTETVPRSKQWYGAVGNLSLLSLGTALRGVPLGMVFEAIGIIGLLELLVSKGEMSASRWLCAVGWSILLSPLGWINYWILLAAPLIVVLYGSGERRERIATLCWGIPLLYWPTSIETASVEGTIFLSHVPTFALIGLMLLLRRNDRRIAT